MSTWGQPSQEEIDAHPDIYLHVEDFQRVWSVVDAVARNNYFLSMLSDKARNGLINGLMAEAYDTMRLRGKK